MPLLAPVMTITGSSAMPGFLAGGAGRLPALSGVEPTEARFPARSRVGAGHYESYYLKACHPEEPLGVWIRYTVHKRPGERAQGLGLVHPLRGRRRRPVARQKITVAGAARGRARLDRVGEAAASARRALSAWAGDAWWELSLRRAEAPLFHLPRDWMYRAQLPKTKLCSPAPAARFGGRWARWTAARSRSTAGAGWWATTGAPSTPSAGSGCTA